MNTSAHDKIADLSGEQRAALARSLRGRLNRRAARPGGYDVAILGGGVAGLTLALHLHQAVPQARVVIIEKQRHPVPEATHKVGESTVEIAAHYLRDTLGLGDHLDARQIRKFGLRMFFSNHDNTDITRRVELGSSIFPPLSTYQLDRGRLENELGTRVVAAGVEFLDGARVLDLKLRPEAPYHVVRIERDGETRELSAGWVVDSTGRSQILRREVGAARTPVGHRANAAWFRLGHPLDIGTWTEDAGWHARVAEGDKALSTNHLMGDGYWVWIIRLASGSTSIGIVADAQAHAFNDFNALDKALAWLREHEPQCAAAIEEHRNRIQDFRVMRDYSYSCERVYDGAQRWCLTGESGVFLDPLYSPGLDLIAISNGLVVDLISRSFGGEDVTTLAGIHDKLFRTIAEIWLAIYEKQYSLLGNAQVMSSKVIWDTAFYWGVFGLLFFHDAFRTLATSPTLAADLGRLTTISNRIQQFYREWAAIDDGDLSPRFVDLYAPLNFMVKLHAGMADGLSPRELEARFSDNVRLFEQLAGQLISTVIATYSDRTDDATVEQIQAWQRDALVASVLATYRRERRANPTSTGWMTLSAAPHAAVAGFPSHPSTDQNGSDCDDQRTLHASVA